MSVEYDKEIDARTLTVFTVEDNHFKIGNEHFIDESEMRYLNCSNSYI